MKFRRRKYIVNTRLQMRYTLSFVLVSLLGSIVAVVAFNFFALRKFDSLMWSTHINVKTTGEIIRPLFIYVNVMDFLFVSILLFITGIWMIRKISGPLYRMSKDVRRAAGGDLSTTMAIRSKDELKDIAHELKLIIDGFKERFTIIHEKYAGISKSIEESKYQIRNLEITTKNCISILENINTLEKEMHIFKLRKKQSPLKK